MGCMLKLANHAFIIYHGLQQTLKTQNRKKVGPKTPKACYMDEHNKSLWGGDFPFKKGPDCDRLFALRLCSNHFFEFEKQGYNPDIHNPFFLDTPFVFKLVFLLFKNGALDLDFLNTYPPLPCSISL
jgi:hypothetical protein